ncbi:hypothetical protein SISSUDRAFT_1044705 [Sistotremastrum suecicum HHB10207 ss-3]|uniref:Uncharacterized protein n=1 Tax=Sistotremastrum suecicum HHB10207 ss-3 TaxID=1314776 RepID=A0A166EYX0_9AGAM|nr:hypothetical protein SISSUDRAFT_1044705 [Sistotremastrum suecicum HHB10207 ss-3]
MAEAGQDLNGVTSPHSATSERALFSQPPKQSPRHKSKRREKDDARAERRDRERLLLYEQRETKFLRSELIDKVTLVEAEMARANEAESRLRELIVAKKAAVAEAARANEELQLYKIQLGNANKEIQKAQLEYNKVAEQRNVAQESAAKVKQELRLLKEERLLEEARNQGREEGLRQGYEEGREEGRMEEREKALRAFDRLLRRDGSDRGALESILSQRENYFQSDPAGPSTRERERPSRYQNISRNTDRSEATIAEDPREIIDEPLPAITTEPPDIDRRDMVSPPRSVHNEVLSPRPHGEHLPDGYIPTSAQGRISLPPPHEIDPSPGLSPRSNSIRLPTTSRPSSPGDILNRDYAYSGEPAPTQDSNWRPASPSSASSRVSNYDIARGEMLADDSNAQTPRRAPLRNAVSPGLSVIPEGSVVDPSSPRRMTEELDRRDTRSPRQSGWDGDQQWNEPRGDTGFSGDRRYSDTGGISLRNEPQIPSRSHTPVSRRSSIHATPARGNQDLPDNLGGFDTASFSNNMPAPAPYDEGVVGRDIRSVNGFASPRSTRSRALSDAVLRSPAQSLRHRRSESMETAVPEITIHPPSRPPSNISRHTAANYESNPMEYPGPLSRPVTPTQAMSRPRTPIQSMSRPRTPNQAMSRPRTPQLGPGEPPIIPPVPMDYGFFEATGPPIPDSGGSFDVQPVSAPLPLHDRTPRASPYQAPVPIYHPPASDPFDLPPPRSRPPSTHPIQSSQTPRSAQLTMPAPYSGHSRSRASSSSSASGPVVVPAQYPAGRPVGRLSTAQSPVTTVRDSMSSDEESLYNDPNRRVYPPGTPAMPVRRARSVTSASSNRSRGARPLSRGDIPTIDYETASIHDGTVYPDHPIPQSSINNNPVPPRGILRNSRTPARTPAALPPNDLPRPNSRNGFVPPGMPQTQPTTPAWSTRNVNQLAPTTPRMQYPAGLTPGAAALQVPLPGSTATFNQPLPPSAGPSIHSIPQSPWPQSQEQQPPVSLSMLRSPFGALNNPLPPPAATGSMSANRSPWGWTGGALPDNRQESEYIPPATDGPQTRDGLPVAVGPLSRPLTLGRNRPVRREPSGTSLSENYLDPAFLASPNPQYRPSSVVSRRSSRAASVQDADEY